MSAYMEAVLETEAEAQREAERRRLDVRTAFEVGDPVAIVTHKRWSAGFTRVEYGFVKKVYKNGNFITDIDNAQWRGRYARRGGFSNRRLSTTRAGDHYYGQHVECLLLDNAGHDFISTVQAEVERAEMVAAVRDLVANEDFKVNATMQDLTEIKAILMEIIAR